jgi:multiple sugar transport system substrate-binding protein
MMHLINIKYREVLHMVTRRKTNVILAAILAILLVLTACSNSSNKNASDNTGTGNNSASSDKPVKITFTFWGNNEEVANRKSIVEKFNDTHPDIQVEPLFVDVSAYVQKLQANFTSKTPADIIQVAADYGDIFTSAGVLEDLTSYMTTDGSLSAWETTLSDAFKWKDGIYAAPHVYNAPFIVYNKDLFDEANVTYPTEKWSEQQFLEAAQKITKGEGINKFWGLLLSWYPNTLVQSLYGSSYYDKAAMTMTTEGNDTFKAGFTMLTDLIAKHKVSPTPAAEKAAGGGFETGKYGMAITAAWDIPQFQKVIGDQFAWDIVPFPVNETYGQWRSPLYANGLALSSASKNKEAAWEFIKWATTDIEAQTLASELAIPAATSVSGDATYLAKLPEGWKPYNKKVTVDVISTSTSWWNTGIYSQITNEVLGKQLELVAADKNSVEDAMHEIQTKGQAMFDKSKK